MYHKLDEKELKFLNERMEYWLEKAVNARTESAEKWALERAENWEVLLKRGVVSQEAYKQIKSQMRVW